MKRIEASTENGKASFVLSAEPSATDIERLATLASMPGLLGATWTAREDVPRR